MTVLKLLKRLQHDHSQSRSSTYRVNELRVEVGVHGRGVEAVASEVKLGLGGAEAGGQ